MEALLSAYGCDKEEEEEEEEREEEAAAPQTIPCHLSTEAQDEPGQPVFGPQLPPPPLLQRQFYCAAARFAPSPISFLPSPASTSPYISKRQRAAMSSPAPDPAPVNLSPALTVATVASPMGGDTSNSRHDIVEAALGPVLDYDLPKTSLRGLKCLKGERFAVHNRLPKQLSAELQGHTNVVNAVRWSPLPGFFLASAGMDCQINIWKIANDRKIQEPQTLRIHSAAVKDLQWTADGCDVLSCGFDKMIHLTDLHTGQGKQSFAEDQFVNVVKFHPSEKDLFVSGGTKGALKLWDIRSGKAVRDYGKDLWQVLDIDFSLDGTQLATSMDIANRNASDKTIVIWDFRSQVPLSNQVYLEAYTCPCVRYHNSENFFVAQSNGNYIAIFSGRPPFKMNKYKRYEGHEVSGFSVKCNFSPDGEILVSGSADGRIFFYHYKSSRILKILDGHKYACSDVSYHPVKASTIATCGWDGIVRIYE